MIPLLLAACDPVFRDGGTLDPADVSNGGAYDLPDPHGSPGQAGSGGAGGTGGVGGTGGGGVDPGPLTAAVAMTRAQRDVLKNERDEQQASETGSVVSTTAAGGQAEQDPNDLLLHISDIGESCDVYPIALPCGGHWRLWFTLPAAYQQVGIYDLDDQALHGSVFRTGAPSSSAPDACPMGGGTVIPPGTLEVLAIDSVEVRFRLTIGGSWAGGDPSGEYTAPRCP
ncbi:hypothetical protein WMF38_35470 [Sorangium sp. So ce118]